MTGRPCEQCYGTDTAYECARGQCYAEYQRQQDDEWNAEQQRDEEEYWRRLAEEEGQP